MNTLSKTDIYGYVSQLCDSLERNYKEYRIRMHETNFTSFKSQNRTDLSDYAQEQLRNIENGTEKLMKFACYEGRKYFKVVQNDFRNGEYRDASVHAFINKETGEVFKPAGYNKPARGVRYNLTNETHRNFLIQSKNVDWAGGYLYIR